MNDLRINRKGTGQDSDTLVKRKSNQDLLIVSKSVRIQIKNPN